MKCTLGCTISSEIADVYSDQEDLDNSIIQRIYKYAKTPEELNKYANWFFHPKGDVSFPSKTSTQSVALMIFQYSLMEVKLLQTLLHLVNL